VFKRHDAPYAPGRPASGGSQLKFKFVATASVMVEKVNAGRRSVALLVFDEKGPIPVGNVTIPQKTIIPQRGTIIEVRYLNVNPGGALYQPVYLGVRDDLDRSACTVSQLKLRADDPDRSEP
jgi:bifunctional non-homologous end joining protein LigD